MLLDHYISDVGVQGRGDNNIVELVLTYAVLCGNDSFHLETLKNDDGTDRVRNMT